MLYRKIPNSRYIQRQEYFCKNLFQNHNIEHFIVISPNSIYYLTGFSMIPTERPFFLIFCNMKGNSSINLFVPELEKEHVKEEISNIKNLGTYFEYPDLIHPLSHFANFLKNELKITGKLGAESAGAANIWGYQGPKFQDVLKLQVKVLPDIIVDMRIIKDKDEQAAIRESSKWGCYAHQLLQKFTAIGKNEIDVSFQASHEASKKMREVLGPEYSPIGYGSRPCGAGYRGQIGTYSAIPHALTRNTVFQKGDTLVTGASANVSGYLSELERTMFIGTPSQKQEKYFKIMLKAQEAAFNNIMPEVSFAEVDKATRKVFKDTGVFNLVQHHTGHAIGLEGHERPFLDIGFNGSIKPGMVFTVEPGIYDRSIGGFRHSDTIIVNEEKIEIVTNYPRHLEDLIIEM